MQADFEEKEFETQLNAEMRVRYGFIYAPGQVLEHTLGIDAALMCPCTEFWKIMDPPHPDTLYPIKPVPNGIALNSSYWESLNKNIDYFPKFSFNLFLQHKRPEYHRDARSYEWDTWQQPYYRYDVTPHQQEALENLEEIAKDDALVGYSCPAFHTYSDLWNHSSNQNIVSQTNFVSASVLKDHKRYTFIDPGASGGVACSEPTQVSGMDLLEETARRRVRESTEVNHELIFRLSRYVVKAVQNTPLDSDLMKLATSIPGEFDDFCHAILKINSFGVLTRTRWMIATM